MPAWIWPQAQKAQTDIAIRLGRVLHWIGVGILALTLVLSVAVAISTASSASQSVKDHVEWETRHPLDSNGSRIATPRPIDAGEYWTDPDDEPYVHHFDWSFVLAIPAIGIAFAMFGRGLRYIIAGE
ncbi:hypothetical protein [Sphingomonas sp. OK281]|uniref:hypothetical protein n=1 Tax=Sphingomonas sp. OK281 TaxID=1881067 RepID=UPI0008E25B21|nr:hypothetical protein [Sphingomonas sp. OK281]SFO02151.1 hypothetical protein SAMN05428984_1671 [Sphingomonas sp. OK281]